MHLPSLPDRAFLQRLAVALLVAATTLSCLLSVGANQGIQAFLYQSFILPIAYILWLVSLFVGSFHQALLWLTGIAVIGFILAVELIQAILALLPEGRAPEGALLLRSAEKSGRIQFWRGRLHMLRRALNTRSGPADYASFEFRHLAQAIWDLQGAAPGDPVPLPPAVQPILGPFSSYGEAGELSLAGQVGRWLGGRLPAAAEDADPLDELCHYLEGQLELEHEHKHRTNR